MLRLIFLPLALLLLTSCWSRQSFVDGNCWVTSDASDPAGVEAEYQAAVARCASDEGSSDAFRQAQRCLDEARFTKAIDCCSTMGEGSHSGWKPKPGSSNSASSWTPICE